MLELQRDFRALLGQATVFEGVGKLVSFPDAQQELRLRHEFLGLHAMSFCGGGESGEVYVGGDVLFPGRFVGIITDRMLTDCLQRSAMAACQLFFAGVAVVDGDEKSSLDSGSDV